MLRSIVTNLTRNETRKKSQERLVHKNPHTKNLKCFVPGNHVETVISTIFSEPSDRNFHFGLGK